MYKAFYSLSTSPFSKENGATFTAKSFSEASARLNYLCKTRGIGLLVGEPGAGKTYALKTFSEQLKPFALPPRKPGCEVIHCERIRKPHGQTKLFGYASLFAL